MTRKEGALPWLTRVQSIIGACTLRVAASQLPRALVGSWCIPAYLYLLGLPGGRPLCRIHRGVPEAEALCSGCGKGARAQPAFQLESEEIRALPKGAAPRLEDG